MDDRLPAREDRSDEVEASPREAEQELASDGQADAEEQGAAAQVRDIVAGWLDQAAEDDESAAAEAERREAAAERGSLTETELRAHAQAARARAVKARSRAAADRRRAARDRERAARDREAAARGLAHAATDDLTGAKRRGAGLEQLKDEMQRARRANSPLVASYIDVDGLKQVNDELGHAAGDDLLASVADAVRHRTRPYDLLVRLGGDEFVCVLPISLNEAHQRLAAFEVDLDGSRVRRTVSVGFSLLRDGDTVGELIRRADRDMLARRRASRKPGTMMAGLAARARGNLPV